MLSTLSLKYCSATIFDVKNFTFSPFSEFQFWKKNEFHLQKLPFIAKQLVLELMDPAERFNISLTSKRMEAEVRCSRTQHYSPIIVFFDNFSKILLKENEEFKMTFKVKTRNWYNNSKIESIIENTARAVDRLQKSSKCGKIEIRIRMKSVEKSFIEELLSNKMLENYLKISMNGARFDSDALNYFMNTAKFDSRFHFRESEMSVDFKNENAFKFQRTIYDDARWVQLDDLLQIVKVERVSLYRTNLTSNDVRTYLTHWINSEFDMFQYLKLFADEDIALDGLFDSIVILGQLHHPGSTIFTLAKSSSRVLPVLAITYGLSIVILSAWKPDETFKNDRRKDDYKKTYEILQLLERKKTLDNELEQENNGIDRRKKNKEMTEIMEKLLSLGVFFEDGRAFIV